MNNEFKDVNVFSNKVRKEFLLDLPPRIRNNLRGIDLALINEAIGAILEGNATIDGKAPLKRTQIFIVIAFYFETAKTPQNAPWGNIINISNKCTVQIKYKDKTYTHDFPENRKETIKS